MPARPPHPGDLIKVIRALAQAGKIKFSRHVLDERMPERGFDIDDVQTILTKGMIEGDVTPGKRPNEWKCLVVDKLPGNSRETGVATVVARGEFLIVATVEWIDP